MALADDEDADGVGGERFGALLWACEDVAFAGVDEADVAEGGLDGGSLARSARLIGVQELGSGAVPLRSVANGSVAVIVRPDKRG